MSAYIMYTIYIYIYANNFFKSMEINDFVNSMYSREKKILKVDNFSKNYMLNNMIYVS